MGGSWDDIRSTRYSTYESPDDWPEGVRPLSINGMALLGVHPQTNRFYWDGQEMWWLGFNLSVAVAVGFIALACVAAETGVIMLIYLDHALADAKARCVSENRKFSRGDLHAAIMHGAVERVRPKMMTVVAITAGLLAILWSTGAGSEVMQRIAVPMIGGMMSSTVLTLVVISAVYGLVKGWSLPREAGVESMKGAAISGA